MPQAGAGTAAAPDVALSPGWGTFYWGLFLTDHAVAILVSFAVMAAVGIFGGLIRLGWLRPGWPRRVRAAQQTQRDTRWVRR